MRATVNGVAVGYESAGSGPTVLFLHAFPLNRAMWASQVETLKNRTRTLLVDYRGFGESELPPAPLGLETLADDAVAVARSLGITRAIVVGLSLGGYVAFRMAERTPEFVQALVLADTRAEADTPEARARRVTLADRVEREGMSAMQDFIHGLLGTTTRATRPEIVGQVNRIIGDPHPRAVAAVLRAMGDRPDSRPLLPSITVPTLVVVGEEDGLTTPDSARVIADGIRGARLVVIPKTGHLSNLEAPQSFNQELTAFVRVVT